MSLRDQMLKAGLISEDQARRTAHQQRVKKKRTPPQERQQESEARKAEVREQQEAERARNKALAQEQAQRAAAKEADLSAHQKQRTALETAYRDGVLSNWEGPRRYYYAAHGVIDWLMVNDETARKLENGQVAIVAAERNSNRHIPLLAGAARKLRDIAPERVLVMHDVQAAR